MKLTEEQKTFLVCRYAHFRKTWEVCVDFKEEYGVEVFANQVSNYDIGRRRAQRSNRDIHKWIAVWEEARAKFVDDVTSIPVANATYRIQRLDEMFDIAFKKKNYATAAKLLEQAAKETGGAYTNRSEINAKVDADVSVSDESAIPAVVKRDMLAHRIREAFSAVIAENQTKTVAPAPPVLN